MAFDAFVKMDPIPGESSDQAHKDWIEILDFSFGVSQPASGASTGGSKTAGRADFSVFKFSKLVDIATPLLFVACAGGEHFKEVKVELCRAGGDKQKYMEFKLLDGVVTSWSAGGEDPKGETLPIEELGLAFGKIEITYFKTDNTGKPKGVVAGYWELSSNKGA